MSRYRRRMIRLCNVLCQISDSEIASVQVTDDSGDIWVWRGEI